jgi:hypothetical protein
VRTTSESMSRTPHQQIPKPLLVPAVIGIAFLLLPLVGLLVRAPWHNLPTILRGVAALQALELSLWTATCATAFCVIVGVPLAYVMARAQFPGKRVVRALVILPLVLPPVVGGVALLLAFGRNGIFGRWLDDWFGLSLPFTPAAVIMAQTFVAMPFLIITVEGAIRNLDRGRYDARGTSAANAAACDFATHRAFIGSRSSAQLGSGLRRIRRDDHVCRELPWPHGNHADRRVLRTGERPRGSDRAKSRSPRGVTDGPYRAPRPLAA